MLNLCICTDLQLDGKTGAAARIMDLAKNVSKSNVTVFVVNRAIQKSFRSFIIDDDKYYRIKNGVIEELDYPLSVRFLFPGAIKFWQEILNRLVSIATFSNLHEISFSHLIDPHLIVKLLHVGKKEQIDLLQCEFPITAPSAFIAKKLLQIPLIYDAHNVEAERMAAMPDISSTYAGITKVTEKICCTISNSIFVVSEIDKEHLVKWGISEQKLETIPNSVDISKYSTELNQEIRNQYHLNGKIVVIFHGPLKYLPNKEATEILINEIMPRIWEKYPEVYLFLVGNDPPKISHPNVVTTGFVENLPNYIAAADIAVVPLLSGGGTRIKILEYMASGKPIVSTQKGAEGLDLINGEDILITKNPDSQFVNAVSRLIADSSLRKKIGANAKKKALSYDWAITAEKAVKIYNKLVCPSG
jgi:polysaccharide biosynthesis protein PslH